MRKIFILLVLLVVAGNLNAAKSDGCPRLARPNKPPTFILGLFDGAGSKSDIGFALQGIRVARDLTAESRGDPKILAGLDGTWFVQGPERPEPLTEVALQVRLGKNGGPQYWRLHRVVTGEGDSLPNVPLERVFKEKPLEIYPSQNQPVHYDAAPHPDTPLGTARLRSGTRVYLTLLSWVGDRLLRVKLPPVALKVLRAVR